MRLHNPNLGTFPLKKSFLSSIKPGFISIPGTSNSAIFTSIGILLTTNVQGNSCLRKQGFFV